ncbi:ATP-dependent Clp protease proteolytic subunit [Arachidicoccus ginsenosidivorans]|uniref:ATP-dependent Clp protease proteolytic subunit n=1 Tax=Arachidicoccus ginsenosidivorans TaxID=496057 RepID=A0A5B8VNY1_9BACT|nr:ATP-dependent Clp protease proteolytic subunit [Arachidicoccus ginsenosidivorans]QEC73129.1 ATP-dependent Clp protease proteolytic subunit [Arachidicoccus ginsenosidivorans]
MNTLYKSPFFTSQSEEEEDQPENKPDNNNQEQKSSLLLKKQEELFLEKRAVYLWGMVDDKSAREIVSKLLILEADKPGEEIKFYINSPGGMVTSGMVIYDTIEMISSPVSTICMGLAASMGSILLSVGAKGRRFVFPHGEIMIHQPSIGGYFQATSADIEIQAEQIEKTKLMGAQLLAKNCGKTVEQVLKDFDRDFYMDADQAVNYGIVDAVLEKL